MRQPARCDSRSQHAFKHPMKYGIYVEMVGAERYEYGLLVTAALPPYAPIELRLGLARLVRVGCGDASDFETALANAEAAAAAASAE